MFREMRRKDRQMSMDESLEMLKNNNEGFLSTLCENGYPYAVPLNYAYFNDCVYFHCARDGQKIDNINSCDKVSFCVTSDIEVMPEEFSTRYKSVILFGKASEVTGQEKDDALLELIKKYSDKFIDEGKKYIERSKNTTRVYRINIEHLTGKIQK